MNISRLTRHIATLTATLAVTGAAMAAVASPAQAAGGWQLHQLDRDRCYDMATLDLEGNGYPNDIRMDTDNDCRWDTRQWNTIGHDSFHERMSFDMNEDGRVWAMLTDTDQRAGFDYVIRDNNNDGYWDTGWRPFGTHYSVLWDMGLAATRLGPGQWVYNPYA